MRLKEIFEDKLGIDSPSPEECAAKHNVPLEMILQQLEQGVKVEREHTDDEEESREIALDHLWELPDYYTRLHKMEHS